MLTNKKQILQIIVWLSPTWLELVLYLFIGLLTIFLSNLSIVNDFLFATGDFNPIRAGIDSVGFLLEKVVGERVAGSLSLAFFWGLVGLMVNVIWWVGSNFSTELNNDLVFSRYVHPKYYDPKSPLREFVRRTAVRTTTALVFIFYMNFFIREAIPHITTRFFQIISEWKQSPAIGSLLLYLILEMILLHIIVVLTRLILLRKQIFSS